MADLSSLDNFVSGSVFKFGIDDTIFNNQSDEGSETKYTFLVLFDSSVGKIIASSKSLSLDSSSKDKNTSLTLNSTNDLNGCSLTIEKISSKYTKNYLSDGETLISNGFALIKASGKEEQVESEKVIFPDLNSSYVIMVKGKLSNTPAFSNGTSFEFNPMTIEFGVVDTNGN